jgi:hypothetical protein
MDWKNGPQEKRDLSSRERKRKKKVLNCPVTTMTLSPFTVCVCVCIKGASCGWASSTSPPFSFLWSSFFSLGLFGEFFYNKMKRGDQKIFHQKALVSVTRVTFHSCAQCRNGVDEIFSSSIERNSLPHRRCCHSHCCVCIPEFSVWHARWHHHSPLSLLTLPRSSRKCDRITFSYFFFYYPI